MQIVDAALRIRSSPGDGEERRREGESGAVFSTTRADSATQAAKRCYWRGSANKGDSGKVGKTTTSHYIITEMHIVYYYAASGPFFNEVHKCIIFTLIYCITNLSSM